MGKDTEDFRLFGPRLREVRRAKDLTQQQLAKIAGTHHVHISRIEQGQRIPGLDLAAKLATALGVSVAALLAPPKKGRR